VYSTVFLILSLILYGSLIEPNKVETHHVWIQDRYLAQIFNGRVIVQLSDLHIDALGKREQKVLEILDKLKPDIIFLTGDYVAWDGDYEPALKFLSKLHAKIGVWAVMGDYDYSNSRKSCLFCHEEGSGKPSRRHSVRFLRDNLEVLNLPEGSVRIAGTDIEEVMPGNSKVWSELKHNNIPAVVLSHNPLAFDVISDNQTLLMLAGDTHGGQIPIPSWVFSIIGYKKNALYSQGLFERGGNRMFVSRGIGTSHLPIRLFRQPEVVVLHFVP
jgi:predicted MPP superfamily phosphohydrolase